MLHTLFGQVLFECTRGGSLDDANFIAFSDGAVRGTTGEALAAWVILAMQDFGLTIVIGGVRILPIDTTSLQAEAHCLELAMEHFHKIIRME